MIEHTKIKNERNETVKAGCVVVNDRNEILLVSDKERKIWTFPKGHAEQGETLEQTALREVKEETGYTVEIVRRRSDVAYTHGQTGEPIRVAMFEAKLIGEPEKSEEEIHSEWFPIEKVRDIIAYDLGFIVDEMSEK